MRVLYSGISKKHIPPTFKNFGKAILDCGARPKENVGKNFSICSDQNYFAWGECWIRLLRTTPISLDRGLSGPLRNVTGATLKTSGATTAMFAHRDLFARGKELHRAEDNKLRSSARESSPRSIFRPSRTVRVLDKLEFAFFIR